MPWIAGNSPEKRPGTPGWLVFEAFGKVCRLSPEEWVLKGMETQKLEFAIQAYMQRKTDLRGGAAMAGVPHNRFLREVQARNIVILENDRFLDHLVFLAEAFDNETLRQAIERVEHHCCGTEQKRPTVGRLAPTSARTSAPKSGRC